MIQAGGAKQVDPLQFRIQAMEEGDKLWWQ